MFAGDFSHADTTMHIDLKHLRTLSALAETGSLTAAAERLHLTQSALSHQLKALEAQLDAPLFVRKSRPLRLTRQGRRTYTGAVKETRDPWGRPHYWIGGGVPSIDSRHDTDGAAVEEGYVSITPLHLDLTNYQALDRLRQDLVFRQTAPGEFLIECSPPAQEDDAKSGGSG